MTKGIQELASNIKTEKDLNEFSAMLKKLTIELALNAELREHFTLQRIIITVMLNDTISPVLPLLVV